MRDFAAELAEYDRVAAPICGCPLELFILRTPDDKRLLAANVALCESHLMDWLQAHDSDEFMYTFWPHDDGFLWIVEVYGHVHVSGTSRLLALIQAVARTQGENE